MDFKILEYILEHINQNRIDNKNIGHIKLHMNIPAKELSQRESFYNEKKSVKIYDSIDKICGEYITCYFYRICLESNSINSN